MIAQGMIGMALLRGNWTKTYHENPEIYSVGCMGEIVKATPFPDGRYNIVLFGVQEFMIQEHILDDTPYRQARVVLREEPAASEKILPGSLKKEILVLLGRALEEKESGLIKILADPSLEGTTWLNLCCFSLNLPTLEKQSLLEAKSLEERANYLLNVLHFRVAERVTPFQGLLEPKGGKTPH